MEVPKDILLLILQGEINVIFKLPGVRRELCGERNITSGRKSYVVVDVLSTSITTMDKILEKDVIAGGFASIHDFEKWWFMQGYREYNPIYVVRFDLLKLKPLGRWYLKKLGKKVPVIKEKVGDYDE